MVARSNARPSNSDFCPRMRRHAPAVNAAKESVMSITAAVIGSSRSKPGQMSAAPATANAHPHPISTTSRNRSLTLLTEKLASFSSNAVAWSAPSTSPSRKSTCAFGWGCGHHGSNYAINGIGTIPVQATSGHQNAILHVRPQAITPTCDLAAHTLSKNRTIRSIPAN